MGVYKRGHNWYVRFKYQGTIKRHTAGPSKRVATALFSKIKAEIAENKYLDIRRDKSILFSEFIIEYEKYANANMRSWSKEKSRVNLLNKQFGHKKLNEIVFQDLERYKIERLKDHPAVKKAGLNDLRFHDLRHTCGSWIVQKTGNLQAAKEILGHSTLKMVLRYSHLANTHLRKVMSALDKDVKQVTQIVTQSEK